MLYTVMRYLMPVLSLLVIGPIAGRLTWMLRGLDGGTEASLLMCASPVSGVLAGLGAIGLALGVGAMAAWTVGKRSGLVCAGLVLAWASWGTGRSDFIVERMLSGGVGGSVLRTFAIEGLLVGALGTAAAWVILRVPTMVSALPEHRDPEHAHHHLPRETASGMDSMAAAGFGAALAAAAVAVWVITQETLKGQTFAAAVVAGVAAGAAGRLVAPRASAAVFIGAIGALGVVGPMVATMMHGSPDGAVKAALAGRLFALARPLPLDLMAGAFVGLPMGLVWAGSMLERHQHAEEARPARR